MKPHQSTTVVHPRLSFTSVLLVLLCGLAAGAVAAQEATPVTRIPKDGAPVAIRSWLIAGPFPSPTLRVPKPNRSLRAGYDIDYLTSLGGEAAARPRPGTAISLPGGGEVRFVRRDWSGDYADLLEAFGNKVEVVAYLYAEVESPVAQDVYLHVGVNDAGKVWVGGRLVVAQPVGSTGMKSSEVARVRLPAGRTSVLVKVDQWFAKWGAFVEFYGRTAHERVLAASSPAKIRAALASFERLRREINEPASLAGAQRDAYALALYSAERLERRQATAAPGVWQREILSLSGYIDQLYAAVDATRKGIDPYAGKSGLFEAAYLSGADGTAQPFTVWLPRTYSAERRYPLLLDLHGGGSHERSGSWWTGFAVADTAFAESTIGVSVLGRGRYNNYACLGEDDVFQVIAWIKGHYAVDDDRVYISGISMGGYGTWSLAARHPDLFAAAWVDCSPFFNDATLSNLLNLPIYVNHGGSDWRVAVSVARLGVRTLEESGAPVAYTEFPGVGHGVVASYARAGGCMTRLAAHRRVVDPPHIRISADHPRYAAQYWGAIEEWIDPHAVASIEAQVLPGNVVSVNLVNVARARLAPPTRHLDAAGDITWLAGGHRVVTPRSAHGRYEIAVADSTIAIDPYREHPEPDVRPYAPGSILNLYWGEPYLIVYGTRTDAPALARAIREMADDVSPWTIPDHPMEFGRAPVVADTALTDAQMAMCNLFLIGGPRENSVAARLMARMPVREEDGALRSFDAAPIPLDGRGYAFVYPNPEHPRRLAFFYGSAVPQFYTFRRSLLATWWAGDDGSRNPDLVVHQVARADSMNDARENFRVHQEYFTNGWQPKPVPDGTITRFPADVAESIARDARALRRATAADFCFSYSASSLSYSVGMGSLWFDTTSVSWAEIGYPPAAGFVTFDVRGADLVRLMRHEGTAFPWISPATDSTTIDRGRFYRVVAEEWILLGLAIQHRYNPEQVERADVGVLFDRYLREEWGVAPQ